MNRPLVKAAVAYVIGSGILWTVLAVGIGGGELQISVSSFSRLLSDWHLIGVGVSAPLVLSLVTLIWSRRVDQLQKGQLKLGEELARSRNRLDTVQRQLEDTLAEKDQVREQLTRTTSRMRLQLTRLLSSGRSRERTMSLADCVDPEKLQQLQDALADTLGISSMCLDQSGEQVFRPKNTPAACQLIQSTPLGRQECFWFHRDLGEKAADRKNPIYKRCSACGLLCGAAPLVVDDKHLATWVLGQVKIEDTEDIDLVAAADRFGIPPNSLLAARRSCKTMALAEFESALALAWHVTEEIAQRCHAVWLLSKNVADRRRAEKQLRLAWHALDHSGRAFVFVGPEGECLGANEEASALLGYKHDALRRLKIEHFFEPADLDSVQSCHGSDSRDCVVNVLTLDGKKIPVKIEGYQVVVAGKPRRYLTLQPLQAVPVPSGVDQACTETSSRPL